MHYVLQGLYAGTQITVFFLLSKLPLLSIHDLCSHKGTFSAWFLFQPVLEQPFHERKRGERKRGEGRDALGKPSLSPPFQCWNSAGTCLLEECRAVFLVDLFTALRCVCVWEREGCEMFVWWVCMCVCYVYVCDTSMCMCVMCMWVCAHLCVMYNVCVWVFMWDVSCVHEKCGGVMCMCDVQSIWCVCVCMMCVHVWCKWGCNRVWF